MFPHMLICGLNGFTVDCATSERVTLLAKSIDPHRVG